MKAQVTTYRKSGLPFGRQACLPSGRVKLVDLPIGRQARLTARKHTKK